jgi:hypothetical protein
MSWDKQTIVLSFVNATIATLKDLNILYTLTELGQVQGNGRNDDDLGKDAEGDPIPIGRCYPIRKLEYGDVVILEQMQRTHDCDTDDVILAFKFEKGKEPKDWQIEITLPDPDYVYPPLDNDNIIEPDPYYDEYPENDYPCDCDSCNGEEE